MSLAFLEAARHQLLLIAALATALQVRLPGFDILRGTGGQKELLPPELDSAPLNLTSPLW